MIFCGKLRAITAVGGSSDCLEFFFFFVDFCAVSKNEKIYVFEIE
mgnify:FL=1